MSVVLSGNTYSESDFTDYGFRQPRTSYDQVVRPMWEAMWVDGLHELASTNGAAGISLVGSTNTTYTANAQTVGSTVTAFIGPNKAFAQGMVVQFYAVQNTGAYFTGLVTAYNSDTGQLTMTVLENSGNATQYTNWNITISGRSGPAGPAGPQGTAGSGSSIVTQASGSTVGTATTLNFSGFGAGKVTFAGGVTTVTLDLSGYADNTLSNVSNANFAAKATAAGVGGGGAGAVDIFFVEAMLGGW